MKAMKAVTSLAISVLLILFIVPRNAAQDKSQAIDQSRLPKILEKTAEYCERLMGMSLNFVCLETIRETDFLLKEKVSAKLSPAIRSLSIKAAGDFILAGSRKNTYLYDYQIINPFDPPG